MNRLGKFQREATQGEPMRPPFPFLAPSSGDKAQDGLEPWDTVLFETDSFVVTPTLGALVSGWLLIVTKESYLCMGAINDTLRGELSDLVVLFKQALSDCYGT